MAFRVLALRPPAEVLLSSFLLIGRCPIVAFQLCRSLTMFFDYGLSGPATATIRWLGMVVFFRGSAWIVPLSVPL